jgi:hypothetical protein
MELSMTSVTQKASIRTTTNFPYKELRRIHKWQLQQDPCQSKIIILSRINTQQINGVSVML